VKKSARRGGGGGGVGGIDTWIEDAGQQGAEENTRTAEEVIEAEDGRIMRFFMICIGQ